MPSIRATLDDLLNRSDVPLPTLLARDFSPSYRQRYASRHRIHVRKRDGATVVQEVYLFARLDAAGRSDCVEEVTLMLDGRPEDQDIGRVR